MLDGFGASGIRGIRFALETSAETHISETNPVSLKIISENVGRNSAPVTVHDESFEETARKIPFDYIDIDPYGSALPYLDAAIRHVKNNGCIGVTATDLSTLTGSFPEKTLRRYGAVIINGSHRHEKGIRLLMAECARRAASIDRAIVPILSIWGGHYYRIFVKVQSGASKADHMLENIGTSNLREIFGSIYPDRDEGRFWKGDLEDPAIVSDIAKDADAVSSYGSLGSFLANEDLNLFFLELSDLGRASKDDLPKIKTVIENISAQGFRAGRTHFSPTGIKTDMDYSNAVKFVLNSMKRQNE